MKSRIKLWVMLDYPCGRRLVAALPEVLEALERHRELAVGGELKGKLLTISPATVDLLLREEKKRYALKSRAKTKPDNLFRYPLPVQTWAEAERGHRGHLQMDLVGSDAGQARGDFWWTLTLKELLPRGARPRSAFHPWPA
ncbi:hypothetical protein EG19_03270 [Thermoanaerobaculum aquaticum]|uniref:Uncharacterized protein n=1 Tax=Thermoanaerobaculum aquaticum TaxID=1312852 RepID=A0A062XMF4_9BACT|nr:hypothetical protein EG19_03270 [Thermoanaerobaculum aquaticum]